MLPEAQPLPCLGPLPFLDSQYIIEKTLAEITFLSPHHTQPWAAAHFSHPLLRPSASFSSLPTAAPLLPSHHPQANRVGGTTHLASGMTHRAVPRVCPSWLRRMGCPLPSGSALVWPQSTLISLVDVSARARCSGTDQLPLLSISLTGMDTPLNLSLSRLLSISGARMQQDR